MYQICIKSMPYVGACRYSAPFYVTLILSGLFAYAYRTFFPYFYLFDNRLVWASSLSVKPPSLVVPQNNYLLNNCSFSALHCGVETYLLFSSQNHSNKETTRSKIPSLWKSTLFLVSNFVRGCDNLRILAWPVNFDSSDRPWHQSGSRLAQSKRRHLHVTFIRLSNH